MKSLAMILFFVVTGAFTGVASAEDELDPATQRRGRTQSPPRIRRERPACPASERMNVDVIKRCSALRDLVRSITPRIEASRELLADRLRQSSGHLINTADIDEGARCATARTVSGAVTAYKQTALPITEARTAIRRDLIGQRDATLQLIATLENLATGSECHRSCIARRQSDGECTRSCNINRSQLASANGAFPSASGRVQMAGQVRREWEVLFSEAERALTDLNSMMQAHDARITEMETVRTQLFTGGPACPGGGVPPAEPIPSRSGQRVGLDSRQPRAYIDPSNENLGQNADPEGAAQLLERRQQVAESVRQNLRLLYSEADGAVGGSGFYCRGSEENRQFCTAMHVPNVAYADWRMALENRSMHEYRTNYYPVTGLNGAALANGIGADSAMDFGEQRTRVFDRAGDVITLPASGREGLQIAAAGDIPRPGQEFTLHGHPGSSEFVYTSLSCRMMGYTPGLHSEYVYMLDCPSASRSIGGMSGGPMVDPNSGVVYGVVSAEYHPVAPGMAYPGRILVAPIRQEGGNIVTGPEPRIVERNCYYGPRSEPRPCSILPRGF